MTETATQPATIDEHHAALVVFVTGDGPVTLETKRVHTIAEHSALPESGTPVPALRLTGADDVDLRWRQERFVDEQGRARVRTHLSFAAVAP